MMRRLIVMALLLSSSLASSARDYQEHPHRHILKVFDANGKTVGAFTFAYGGPGVFMIMNGAPVFVPILRRQVSGTGSTTLYSATEFVWGWYFINQFYSSDCSGPPLITKDTGPRPSFTLRNGSDVTVYVAPTTNSQFLTVSSTIVGTSGKCQRYDTPLVQAGWPAESTYVITQDYPEPLSLHY